MKNHNNILVGLDELETGAKPAWDNPFLRALANYRHRASQV